MPETEIEKKGFRVKREVQELSILYEVSRTLEKSLDLRDVARPILEALATHMGMSRGTITLLNTQTLEIWIDAAHGLSETQKKRGRYKLGEGITGTVIMTGRPIVV